MTRYRRDSDDSDFDSDSSQGLQDRGSWWDCTHVRYCTLVEADQTAFPIPRGCPMFLADFVCMSPHPTMLLLLHVVTSIVLTSSLQSSPSAKNGRRSGRSWK